MKKFWSVVSFIAIISILLVGCGKSDEENNENNENNENAEVNEENNDTNENQAVNGNINEDESNENENNENDSEENIEEETFADEVKVLDVETVLLDQGKVSEFNENENTVIEHEELVYVEHDFITEVLDYELTYDEENTFAEVFAKKGNFSYEPSHEDGALMDIGQIYVEDLDKYENISGDAEELFKFIEYEGKLYVPERLINVFMKSPLSYERREKVLVLGLHSEETSIYDVGITDGSSAVEVTQNASDVTVEGTNYEGGIVIRDINSAGKKANIDIDYNYSEINGFVHNFSDDETIEIKFQYDDDKTLDSIKLEPGETEEFEYDIKGEAIFKVIAEGRPGSSSEAVIIGELN